MEGSSTHPLSWAQGFEGAVELTADWGILTLHKLTLVKFNVVGPAVLGLVLLERAEKVRRDPHRNNVDMVQLGLIRSVCEY